MCCLLLLLCDGDDGDDCCLLVVLLLLLIIRCDGGGACLLLLLDGIIRCNGVIVFAIESCKDVVCPASTCLLLLGSCFYFLLLVGLSSCLRWVLRSLLILLHGVYSL